MQDLNKVDSAREAKGPPGDEHVEVKKAADLVEQLKEQQQEQKKLLAEQKQLINDLKQQKKVAEVADKAELPIAAGDRAGTAGRLAAAREPAPKPKFDYIPNRNQPEKNL